METTTIELNKQDLDHIINDMLHYIDNIVDNCAPDKFVFYHLKKGEILTEEETAALKERGFFERKELIEKLEGIRETAFPEFTCKG